MTRQRRKIKNGRSLADILQKAPTNESSKRENPRSGGNLSAPKSARELFQFGEKQKLKGFAQSYKPKEKAKREFTEDYSDEKSGGGRSKNDSRSAKSGRGGFKGGKNSTPRQERSHREEESNFKIKDPSKFREKSKLNDNSKKEEPQRFWGKPKESHSKGRRFDRSGRGSQVGQEAIGIVKRNPDGFGFLITEDPTQPDVYIPRHEMDGIMTNDRVRAEIFAARDEGRFHGKILSIEARAFKKVVGRIHLGNPLTIPDHDYGWGTGLIVENPANISVKEGDLVAVDIKEYPSAKSDFKGVLLEVLGDIEDPIHDVKRIIFGHHIPHEFSPKAVSEAKRWGDHVDPADFADRKDIRNIDLITIDGATARDFDDAVYVEQVDRGFRCVVAIADVSHYVLPGTQLDQEAYERGNSTYFPNFVVPMLPEELSNNLCSLVPHVPRLCFVADMKLDFEGNIVDSEIYEAVMESKARVTYGEAQEVIEGSVPEKLKHVEANILRCADLARVLMAKRFREGSLDLEIPETQVVVDERGETVDIIKSERLFAHRLIEELMLTANICVARFLTKSEIPSFYRVHESPKADNLTVLQKFLWNFGSRISLHGDRIQKRLTKSLKSFEGKPEAIVLNILTLRSMQQARYSPENLGHFGLGFADYTHFTSPIRRYPDLIVHRLVKSVLYPRSRRWRMSVEELAVAGQMLSATEQRSAKAERQLVSIKKARFMQKFVGQEFEGMISSVTKFGVFVSLRTYDVDGLVKLEKLGDDRFDFDPESLQLIGKKTRKVYKVGEWLKIRVLSVSVDEGRLDFGLVTIDPDNEEEHEMARNGAQTEKRRPSKNDSIHASKVRVPKRRR